MRVGWALGVGARLAEHVGLLFSEPVIEGFALAFLTRRHPELVGLAPVLGRIDHGVAVVVADLIGVG
jgi:hypothetical protein